ncbi:hypothetical protein [Paenibacillus amylolyticus]|uniref:Uncharacterized protein n=1 Tax=Paenibacillus amylolyticus TaxID=1451 RepID=A0A100VT99_PAEAM|nr:hypothetical protein [Paenibacillus amylolyticus]UOK62855.1 hypothetical protein MT997_32780 [Paenibacillus sp. OVF10]GAS85658.1 unknown protein [Paenibacillus amylolyticus]
MNNRHVKVTYADGIEITFGETASRAWIRFMAPILAEEERKRRRKGRKR